MGVFPKLSLLALACGYVQAAFVLQDWTLQAKIIAPDGQNRTAALINGVYPGPLVKANKGDSILINVHNQLRDDTIRKSTSIHWHGLFQARNAQNDGPSFVTQCPIASNNTYSYQLVLGDQAGTFWYHSHLSTQYVDGLRGPLVIYDPNDPHAALYDVDDESTIITLSDWYHTPALVSTNNWLVNGAPEPVPDSGLINSAGRFLNGPAVPRTVINVIQGQRYRFRLISTSATGFFDFAIANHSLTVIEADGISHQPLTVDSIQLLPGQRYSVVVNANQAVDNYWIRATQTVRGLTTSASTAFDGTEMYAVLHYANAPSAEPTAPKPPTTLPAGKVAFQEFNLKPLDPGPPGGTGPADVTLSLTFAPLPGGNGRWMINNTQYIPPTIPTLLNIIANGASMQGDFGQNENTFILPFNSSIEIALVGGAGHAFHLHGHAFDVIRSASGGTVNLIDPPRRDVVATGGTVDPVRIRFRTDNPGPWFLHCHLDFHLEGGLAVVFAEDPNGIRSGPQSIQPNAQWQQLCQIYNSLPDSEK
ncbi:multicopper oxidase [Sphaerobolus stellatus SS14]|uniref:Multicopper oxidase n=1 Tax=Sphaerobolus stellatus (strain SS14) TaxID=990650 RepID=A0A0C9VR16_SPHS4|nr:multicopper oxidase [Sphaerobolus stellatus SS14]